MNQYQEKVNKLKTIAPTLNRETNESFFNELSCSKTHSIFLLEDAFEAFREVIKKVIDAKNSEGKAAWMIFSILSKHTQVRVHVFDKIGNLLISNIWLSVKKYNNQILFAVEHTYGNIPFVLKHYESKEDGISIQIHFSGDFPNCPF